MMKHQCSFRIRDNVETLRILALLICMGTPGVASAQTDGSAGANHHGETPLPTPPPKPSSKTPAEANPQPSAVDTDEHAEGTPNHVSEGPSDAAPAQPNLAPTATDPSESASESSSPSEPIPSAASAPEPAGSAAQRSFPMLTPPQTAVPRIAHLPSVMFEAPSANASSSRELQPQKQADRGQASGRAAARHEHLLWLGALVDVGFPGGVMGGVAARPWPWLRVEGALGTNAVSMGLRGGVALRAPTTVSPSLALEFGHYFEGNANGIARTVAGSDYERTRMAEQVGYDFVNLHAGFEIGLDRATLFVHGGMSHMTARLHNVDDALSSGMAASSQGTTFELHSDPHLQLWVPSLKLGALFFFV